MTDSNIGILMSIGLTLFSILVSYLFITRKKLILIREKEFILPKKDLQNSNIEILSNHKEIKDNIFLYQASLYNTGNLDIDKMDFYSPVRIEFGGNQEILSANIYEKSEDIEANLSFENNLLTLDWNLLKNKEFIAFSAIVKISQNELNPIKDIRIKHRIKNVRSIKEKYFVKETLGKFGIIGSLFFLFMFFTGGTHLVYNRFINPQHKVAYQFGGTSIVADIEFKNDSTVILFQNESDNFLHVRGVQYLDTIPAKTFFNNKVLHPVITENYIMSKSNDLWVGIFLLVIAIVFYPFLIFLTIREYKIRRLIKRRKI